MAQPPISKLPKEKRRELLDDLNYLNTAEIKAFCNRHSIPYTIAIETQDGSLKRTREDDRKGVILNRIRHFLETGVILEATLFPAPVVWFDAPPEQLSAEDRLFYGQYDKSNRAMIALLKHLTGGRFGNGAIARILAREFWSSGRAPTYREFASAWLQAVSEHTRPNPEWAFLSDRASDRAVGNWKKFRAAKASQVMKILGQIAGR
ncbi:MAG TPA: hypothetical protein VMI06_04345 [Terriglobia bacterium]|nr:hypothetical protein [Terriglobia bacterium]